MDYFEFLANELRLPKRDKNSHTVIDLFAGCGGLALGFEAAGFNTIGYEMLEDACATYNHNLHGTCHQVFLEPGLDLKLPKADVVIGGPPCQPFSVGGLQNGKQDERNGFPSFLHVIKVCDPEIVLFENVRGMLYRNKDYLEYILSAIHELGYIMEYKLLHAVQYGVPQKRERLFVVGHRGQWSFPKPTLPNNKSFTAGDALGDDAFKTTECSKFLTPSMDEYVAKYEKKSQCIRPRDLHLDSPSRTVTCRNLNGATGDMMRVRLPDGRRRRLTPRDGARLQSFPDWFEFIGAEGSQFNQVGNAVPPLMAKAMAVEVKKYLNNKTRVPIRDIKSKGITRQLCFNFGT